MENNIKALRERRGYSMEKLAAQLGIRPSSVYKWEHGRADPVMRKAVKLTKILGCTLDQLMGLAPLDQEPQDGESA